MATTVGDDMRHKYIAMGLMGFSFCTAKENKTVSLT
jgi:hypothetical protein